MNKPKTFYDTHGKPISAGDTIRREFIARWRERPGHKRVALDMMDNERIVPDEGVLKAPERHWVEYHVKWEGACLIAERGNCSDFQALARADKFDSKGQRIVEGFGFHYFNDAFDSTVYEVVRKARLNHAQSD